MCVRACVRACGHVLVVGGGGGVYCDTKGRQFSEDAL